MIQEWKIQKMSSKIRQVCSWITVILLLNGNRQLNNNKSIHLMKLSTILIPKPEREERGSY